MDATRPSWSTVLFTLLLHTARWVIPAGAAEFLLSIPADLDSFPWGPTNIGSRSCPIRYPWANETNFCLSVGRQRAIVQVPGLNGTHNGEAYIACATIPWRLRRDIPLQSIGVFVTAQPGGNFTSAIKSGDRIEGEVCFEVVPNAVSYAVYYLPFAYALDLGTGSFHSHFLTRAECGNSLSKHRLRSIKPAKFVRFESYSSHDVRTPMEFAASDDEVGKLLRQYPERPYFVWASLVDNTTDQSIRMTSVPLEIIRSAPNQTVQVPLGTNTGARVVQVILYAARSPIRGVAVDFVSADDDNDDDININCLQTSGVNYRGEEMVPPQVSLNVGEVGTLLFLIEPSSALKVSSILVNSQRFVRITPDNLPSTTLEIRLVPSRQLANLSNSSDVWRLSRLAWLNSKIGLDEGTITRPYSPIRFYSNEEEAQWVLTCRGRVITICSKTGLPVSITSNDRAILSSPVAFQLESLSQKLGLMPTGKSSIQFGPNNASAFWISPLRSQDGKLYVDVKCTMEYDGHLDYAIYLSTRSNEVELKDVSVTFSLYRGIARFAVGGGFGSDGDWYPAQNASLLNWSWSHYATTRGWRLWIGDVDAGLYLKLKGKEDEWNSANPTEAPLPISWAGSNGRSGGIRVASADDSSTDTGSVLVTAFTGPVRAQDMPLVFNFSLVATPTKGDYTHSYEGKREHYQRSRHYHVPYGKWDPPDPCNVFNTSRGLPQPTTLILHQSNRLNPYINWPFHPNVEPELAKYIAHAKKCGVAVKIYYTVHELTNHCVELFAFLSLNGEIFLRRTNDRPPLPGPGVFSGNIVNNQERVDRQIRRKLGQGGDLKGNEWLLEHLVTGYEGAWYTNNPGGEEDAAIFNNDTSRFLNYYISGQKYLYDQLGLAGLYYDSFNGERKIQKRIRTMSESPSIESTVRFDVHGRPFEYTELLPFIDSMWTAEGIDFTRSAAYWLISISALPFGTFGEMLGGDYVPPVDGHFCGESCANRWRGMLFGMSNRAGWNGMDPNHNRNLWKLWDEIAIERASMFGWWNSSSPCRVFDGQSQQVSKTVLATAYVRPGNMTLVAIASWDAANATVSLAIDWDSIGLLRQRASVIAPHIPGFNRHDRSRVLRQEDVQGRITLTVPAHEGWFLIIK